MTTRPTPVINVERELDRVFQAPLSAFITTRQQLATRLKEAGRADEAAAIKRLAKPTVTAWIVNQLYWGERALFERFLEAADQVRAVEEALLAGKEPRGAADAAPRRDRALGELTERGRAVAEAEQGTLGPALVTRLRTTLEAIGAYGSAAARHARGRLQQDLDPPGFGAMASLAASVAVPARRRAPREKRKPEPPALTLVRKTDTRRAEAEAALAEARAEAARRQDQATAAADAERRARASLEHAEKKLAEAEAAVSSAKEARASAARALRARETEARKAAASARAASAALDRARKALK